LSQHVYDTWHRLRALLEAARCIELGSEFVLDGTTWTRVSTDYQRHNRPPVYAINRSTGGNQRSMSTTAVRRMIRRVHGPAGRASRSVTVPRDAQPVRLAPLA
jgi:hypothetical protein